MTTPQCTLQDIASIAVARPGKSAQASDEVTIQPGDLVVALEGRNAAQVDAPTASEPVPPGGARLRLHTPDPWDSAYLKLVLSAATPRLAAGTTALRVPTTSLRALPICWPAAPQRHRVAALARSIDDLRDHNSRLLTDLRDLAEATYLLALDRSQPDTRQLGECAFESRGTIEPRETPDQLFRLVGLENGLGTGRPPKHLHGADIASRKKIVPDHAILYGLLNPELRRVWWQATPQKTPTLCSTEYLVLLPLPGTAPATLTAALRFDPSYADQVIGHTSPGSTSRARIRPRTAMVLPIRTVSSESVEQQLSAIQRLETMIAGDNQTLSRLYADLASAVVARNRPTGKEATWAQ